MKIGDIKKKIKKGTLPIQNFLFEEDIHSVNKDIVDPSFDIILEEYKKGNVLFFSGNVPSLKNSKEIGKRWMTECCNSKYEKIKNGYICNKCGNPSKLKSIPSLRSSDLVIKYKEENNSQFVANKPLWNRISSRVDYPYLLAFYFVRSSNTRFDFDNAKQIILDMFRTNEYIPDDSSDYVRTLDVGYHKNPMKSGVYIFLVKDIKLDFVRASDKNEIEEFNI